VDDEIGLALLERDEFIKPRTTLEGLGSLKVAFAELGAMGFDASPWPATRRSSGSSTCTLPATPRASSTAPRRC
jgi:acetyl-CoA acetyltransferase